MKYLLLLFLVISCGTLVKSEAIPGDLGTFDPYENNSGRVR
jgi:hypothetical protein